MDALGRSFGTALFSKNPACKGPRVSSLRIAPRAIWNTQTRSLHAAFRPTRQRLLWARRPLVNNQRCLISSSQVRTKLSTYQQILRKWKNMTADQVMALVSLLMFGTTFWVIVGTTTLASSILWIANTLKFQEYMTKRISKYVSSGTGIDITFESAIGEWKQGNIRLKNVVVSRTPTQQSPSSTIYLTLEHVDVKLSILWLLEGRGLVKECEVTGVRGYVDRRTEAQVIAGEPGIPPVRRKWQSGDFVLKNLTLHDVLVTVNLPDPTLRPLSVSIFSMECDWFRKHWILLDVLSAKSMVGKFDGSLFSLGIPQQEDPRLIDSTQILTRELKIDGVNLDVHSQNATGPLGWIKEGTFDINLTLTLPPRDINGENTDSNIGSDMEDVIMTLDTQFNHMRVQAPLFTRDLSYLNNALVHPILAYMNAHSKRIPLSFKVHIPVENFSGAWTPYEASMWDAISEAIYEEFSRVVQEKTNTETLRLVAGDVLQDLVDWLTSGFAWFALPLGQRRPKYLL